MAASFSARPGFGYDINSSMLVEKDGTIFYGTKNGLILALESTTGAIRWQHRFGEALANTLSPISSRELLATDADGSIALLKSPHLIEVGDFASPNRRPQATLQPNRQRIKSLCKTAIYFG